MVVYNHTPSTGKVEAGRSPQAQRKADPHNKFQASQDYIVH